MRRPPTRRWLLQAAAATSLARPARAEPAAVASAAAFVDSVGVNVHLGSEPYASGFELFAAQAGASRIRHLRDELRPDNDLTRWRGLDDRFGIKSHLLVSPATNTVPQMLDTLAALGPHRVTAIEGQNEGDSEWFMANAAARFNWSATVVAYQREVFAALRQHYPAATLPVLSPSIIDWKPADVWQIRRAAAYCDIVAIHSYVQHGQEPETTDSEAGLAWYLRHMRDAFKPGAPVMATETGYNNLVKPGGAGVSEAAAAIYLPRLLLHNFAAGVLRTFLYEFMDGGADPAESEHHWGLVRHDGSPKPAYAALRNLLEALAEPAATAVTPVIAPVPANPPPDLRVVPLRVAGGLVVAVWRAVRSWDVVRAADLAVPPAPLVLAAPGARRAAWSMPNEGTGWNDLGSVDETVTVPVSDRVLLLRLSAS